MPYDIQITRRVEFSDTDMAGIMHFSNFFRFMETAEHAFFRSLGHSVVLERSGLNMVLPRVHASCDYLAPLCFEDEVRVHLLVQKKGRRSLTYQFLFHCVKGGKPRAVARGRLVVVCALRQKDGSLEAIPLPPLISAKIQEAPSRVLAIHALPPSAPKARERNHSPRLQSSRKRNPVSPTT